MRRCRFSWRIRCTERPPIYGEGDDPRFWRALGWGLAQGEPVMRIDFRNTETWSRVTAPQAQPREATAESAPPLSFDLSRHPIRAARFDPRLAPAVFPNAAGVCFFGGVSVLHEPNRLYSCNQWLFDIIEKHRVSPKRRFRHSRELWHRKAQARKSDIFVTFVNFQPAFIRPPPAFRAPAPPATIFRSSPAFRSGYLPAHR